MIFKKEQKTEEKFEFNANNLRNITFKAREEKYKKMQAEYLEDLKNLIVKTSKSGKQFYVYTEEVGDYDYLTYKYLEYLEKYFIEKQFDVEKKEGCSGDYLKISWE